MEAGMPSEVEIIFNNEKSNESELRLGNSNSTNSDKISFSSLFALGKLWSLILWTPTIRSYSKSQLQQIYYRLEARTRVNAECFVHLYPIIKIECSLLRALTTSFVGADIFANQAL